MKITLILGCMFAGKSTRLIDMYSRQQSDSKVILSPLTDTRDSENIVTHERKKHPCRKVKELGTDHAMCDYMYVDEIQFFDPQATVAFIAEAKRLGVKEIVMAGLSSDYRQQPFPTVDKVMHEFSETRLIYMCATCDCGLDAYATVLRDINDMKSETNVLIGCDDIYRPICPQCLNQLPSQSQEEYEYHLPR